MSPAHKVNEDLTPFYAKLTVSLHLRGRRPVGERPEKEGGAGRLANLGVNPDEWYADSGDIFPWGPDRGWAERAECAPHNIGTSTAALWFFPDPKAEERWRRYLCDPNAVAFCDVCEVRTECGEYGEKIKAPVGMWGGLDRGLPAWHKLQAKESWAKQS